MSLSHLRLYARAKGVNTNINTSDSVGVNAPLASGLIQIYSSVRPYIDLSLSAVVLYSVVCTHTSEPAGWPCVILKGMFLTVNYVIWAVAWDDDDMPGQWCMWQWFSGCDQAFLEVFPHSSFPLFPFHNLFFLSKNSPLCWWILYRYFMVIAFNNYKSSKKKRQLSWPGKTFRSSDHDQLVF